VLRVVGGTMIKRSVTENGIVADLFHDGSGHPRQALVLLGGSEGAKIWSGFLLRQRLNHLVDLGCTLLSLAYFKSPGLPSTLEEIPLEYFEKVFAWLANQPEVVSDELALMGSSKGAEVSLLLGSMNPSIRAVVALSPSSVVWQGIPKRGVEIGSAAKSSWAYQGQGRPFVPYGLSSWGFGTMLFGKLRKVHEKALQDKSQVEEATIPVEKIQGSILLVSGRRDELWPATDMCEQMLSRLAAKGFGHHFEHIAFNAGHNGYLWKAECWQAIRGFLREHYIQVRC
jgi:hypothetical protein